ncbi:MAG: hypothetical protein DSY80_04475 [Desulfocapsa sp.]|nr:MAG: hypothetical protein DSY80_04475 [Desulfocapsa sp.]
MALKKAVKEDEERTETPSPEDQVPETSTSTKTLAKNMVGDVFIKNDTLVGACVSADWGTFLPVTGSNGTHDGADDLDLGKELEFQVVVQRNVWKMSPNSPDDESREYFASSYEGEEDLEDAKQEAIEAGYENAGVKKYLELYVLLTKCTIVDMIGEVVCLNLAPSSVREWKPLAGKLTVKAAMGKLNYTEVIPGSPAVTFRSVATPGKWKGNKYTYFKFSIV